MVGNRILVAAVVALAAGDSLRAQGPAVAFTPRAGFGGRSEGNGTLRLLLGKPRPFHVESSGHDRPDGTFQLDQAITSRGKPTQHRTWVMTAVGPHQYAATLTDAAGVVAARTDGNRLSLRYRYAGPFVVHQTLELMPGGRTIDNVGWITLLGLPVARLHETIVRKE